MGKYIGPKNKISRRFGINLGLKSNASKLTRRLSQPPGVHGPKKRRVSTSSFGKQLLEKQKVKYIYGIREKQFRGYVKEANRQEGDSGINLQRLLELRMDNVIYRLGIASTRSQARQFVSHNMFKVNNKKMNIPSHILGVGDQISIRENKQKKQIFEGLEEKLSNVDTPSWLSVDFTKKIGKVLNLPTDKDFDKIFDVRLIIEYYSAR